MRSLFAFFFLLISYLLLAQEPVWIQMEDNYPFHISYSRIGTDHNNNIYAVSDWLHPNSYERLSRIVKYLPNGNKEWSINYQADSTSTRGVYISNTGTTYITRTISLTYMDQYSIIFAIDSNGNEVFSHKSYDVNYNDVICDSNGNVYVTGRSFEQNCEDKAVTAKFNESGILEWQSCWEEPCQFSCGKL